MKKILILSTLTVLLFTGCNKKSDLPQNPKKDNDTNISLKNPENYEIDLSNFFGEYSGAFVLFDVTNNYYKRYNSEQCKKRYSPCSTFKIPNSLIALETGIATDENFSLKWDGTKQWMDSWNKDHTLKTAFANSVVWYYRELARRIGEEKMKYYVQKMNYGNIDISGGLDKFWLMNSIAISADEQVGFLTELYYDKLPFSKRTFEIVKDIMILDKTDTSVMRGKTGSSINKKENYSIGWFVGYLENKNNTYIFAANIISKKKVNGIIAKEITYNILKSIKLM